MSDAELEPTFFTNGQIYLGWLDRLRVLFGRPVRFHIQLDTEIPDYAGGSKSHLHTSVDRIFPRRNKPMGEMAIVTDEERVARLLMGGAE